MIARRFFARARRPASRSVCPTTATAAGRGASQMRSSVRGWGSTRMRGAPFIARMIVHQGTETAPRRALASAPRLRLVERPALRVVDVALFYGERSGGIRTYLDAKVRHLPAGACEHHVIVPGPRERHAGGRHELPSLRMAAANG